MTYYKAVDTFWGDLRSIAYLPLEWRKTYSDERWTGADRGALFVFTDLEAARQHVLDTGKHTVEIWECEVEGVVPAPEQIHIGASATEMIEEALNMFWAGEKLTLLGPAKNGMPPKRSIYKCKTPDGTMGARRVRLLKKVWDQK
jgi:hypothetical protein